MADVTGQGNLYDAPVHRIPAELLIQVAENFTITDLISATHISRRWRDTLIHCPALWATLDMVCLKEKALTVVQHLLPRSEPIALDLSIHVPGIRESNYTVTRKAFYLALASHLHRLRNLSLRCTGHDVASPLLKILRAGAPILQSLHVTVGQQNAAGGPSPPKGIFIQMPQLSRIQWLGYSLPATLNDLASVSHIRLSQGSLASNAVVFRMFPRAREICIDHCREVRRLGTLPVWHPLERLELSGSIYVNSTEPVPLDWGDLRSQRCTDVPLLVLRNFNLATLFSACHEGVWQARELSIHYNDDVDAVLRVGARECRMVCLRGTLAAARSVQRLMYERACLRSLERLELSLPLAAHQGWHLLMPQLGMPALTTLVILCARHKSRSDGRYGATGQRGTRLDPDVLAVCGILRAPSLNTILLKSHPLRGAWQDPEYDGVVDPAALAEFIGGHIQLAAGGLLPELRVDSPKLRLADNAEGLAALTAVVGTIIHGL